MRQQPIEARADQHHDVGILQHRRARRARALRMGVGQQSLGHAHGEERNAALLDQALDCVIGLGVGRALAEDDQRTLCVPEDIERAFDRRGRGYLRRRGVDHLDQRLLAGLGVHHLAEQLGRQIEIDAARTSRDRGADRARQPDADVGGVQHAERGLAQRLGDRELVHLFIVALLQVDDLALRRARDQDHRKTVGGGVGERGEAVEEARRRNRQTDAGLPGQEARDRCRVAGILLVAERDDPDARGLRHAAEIRDRDARHPVDRGQPVELQRIDHQVKAVGQLVLGFSCINALRCGYGHSTFSLVISRRGRVRRLLCELGRLRKRFVLR